MNVTVTRTIVQKTTVEVDENIEEERQAVVALDEATDYSHAHQWGPQEVSYTVDLG